MKEIKQILKNIFGYSEFRNQQNDVINAVMSGNDALVIMPTGGGKSLCYQIPAIALNGLAVIVSPLIALMNDQVAALKQLDVKAATLNSNIKYDETNEIYNLIENGDLDLLYVSPEKLLSDGFLYFLKNQKICLFAIDEAHCVSVWGNDFRPEYVKLSILKKKFPQIPCIALTATADSATQEDICKQLELISPQTFLSSFERKNISSSAQPGLKRIDLILNYLHLRQDTSGIIYCLSRKSTESVAEKLRKKGYNAKAYHAGLDPEDRNKIQTDFQDDTLKIVCATIAFGMGIDKPNIRWVIHYNMPKNIEGYYQEIGRAGRDGQKAESLLFYSYGDYINLQKFVDESEASPVFKNVQKAKLQRMWEYASASSCRTNMVLSYFGEFREGQCDHCDNCLNPQESFDGTKYSQMALSALVRTHQNVGLNLLIDILRGSYKQELKSLGYDQLKTFGVGREIPFIHWKHFITQMINQGIVKIDFSDFSKLKLTPLSKAVLIGETKIQLTKYVSPQAKPKTVVPKIQFNKEDVDEVLLAALKSWRKHMAMKSNVPAFVILHDKSLVQIASVKPKNNIELLAVEGIGQAKNMKFGKQILELVKLYL